MEVLLKGSCDACTSSKVKCSGGNPCNRCKAKGIVCSYRPKRKRGPQKGAKTSNKRSLRENGFSFISTYERRVWSVFFTMFKNQNRTRSDAVWAWCWFASQLEKLKSHLISTGNQEAMDRLNAWLEALDVDIKSIVGGMKTKCQFAPNMCGTCSAMAMCVPEKARQSPETVISALHVGKQFAITQNDKPRLLMECLSNGVFVQVNQAFENEFGITGKRFEEILAWSAGGFLPWGGDILAKLLVKESDLHVFLQILAIKASSLGPPEHQKQSLIEREVPSTHIFDLWCVARPTDRRPTLVCSFMVNCINVERIENGVMSTQLKAVFERVGEKRPPSPNEEPVSCEETNKEYKREPDEPTSPGQLEHGPQSEVSKREGAVDAAPSQSHHQHLQQPHTRSEEQPVQDQQQTSSSITNTLNSDAYPENSEEFSTAKQDPPIIHDASRQRPSGLSVPAQRKATSTVDRLPPVAATYYDNWAFFDPLIDTANTDNGQHNSQPSNDSSEFHAVMGAEINASPETHHQNLAMPKEEHRLSAAGSSGYEYTGNYLAPAERQNTSAPLPQPVRQDSGISFSGSSDFVNENEHQEQPQINNGENALLDDGDWLDSILEWSSSNNQIS
mmetsp:Transcript_21749/g.42779  ORF Transcript_21749/g.42779 Transcript_21749/m.42779 type:complete len:616 (-) Transcript_21749:111-1958(-)